MGRTQDLVHLARLPFLDPTLRRHQRESGRNKKENGHWFPRSVSSENENPPFSASFNLFESGKCSLPVHNFLDIWECLSLLFSIFATKKNKQK
jgi:hypothetical protein